MSSILDALEKAEGERIRDAAPGLRPARRKGGAKRLRIPLVTTGLVVLLLLNLAIWWFYLQSVPERETAASAAVPEVLEAVSTEPPAAAVEAAPVVQQAAPVLSLREQLERNTAPSAKPLSAQAQVTRTPVAAPSPRALPAAVPKASPPAAAAAREKRPELAVMRPETNADLPVMPPAEPAPAAEIATAAPTDPVPAPVPEPVMAPAEPVALVWELPQGLREKVLKLKSSVHVYNERPELRFVIIGMHRYGEGETLPPDGFRLHRIDKDGVVIDYGQGLTRLPRR